MSACRGGVRLRAWLAAENHSQQWLGEQIGTHQTNISAWMRGRPISLEMALRIRTLTGIPVEDWAPRSATRARATNHRH